MNRTRVPISVLVWLASLAYAAILVVVGVALPSGFFKPVAYVAALASIAVVAFRQAVWRLPLVNPWLVMVPNLNGTWHGAVHTTWQDPATGKTKGPIHVRVVIRQTFSTMSLRLASAESASSSSTCSAENDADGVWYVSAVYVNIPGATVRAHSQIHRGACRLEVAANRRALNGSYWTDRQTTGELRLEKFSNRCLDACPPTCTEQISPHPPRSSLH